MGYEAAHRLFHKDRSLLLVTWLIDEVLLVHVVIRHLIVFFPFSHWFKCCAELAVWRFHKLVLTFYG